MTEDPEDVAPVVPRTLDDLIVRWAQRDAEYAKVRLPMTAEQADTIRLGRMQEANRLPRQYRARAFTRARTWVAPTHPDFGQLRDWIE